MTRRIRGAETAPPVLNARIRAHAFPVVPAGQGIPRVIHQIFMPQSRMSPEIRQLMADLCAANPGWTHRLYDAPDIDAYIATHYGPEMLAAYRRIDPRYPAARADLFRYLLMYREGGVYLDAKSTVSRPLDAVLRPDDTHVLAHWPNGPGEMFEGIGRHSELGALERGEFQQWHILCAPGSPFLRAAIDAVLTNIEDYRPWLHRTGRLGVLRLSGPLPYTLAILPLLADHPHRIVRAHTDLGLVFNGLSTPHHGLFGRHYSQETASVVRLDDRPLTERIRGRLYCARREWNYQVRRLRRAVSGPR